MFFPHFVAILVTSSANGAFGRHERHHNAGIRFGYCCGGVGREGDGTGVGLCAGATGGMRRRLTHLHNYFHDGGLQFGDVTRHLGLTGREFLDGFPTPLRDSASSAAPARRQGKAW